MVDGYRGAKDPLEGVKVAVELAFATRKDNSNVCGK